MSCLRIELQIGSRELDFHDFEIYVIFGVENVEKFDIENGVSLE